MRVVTLQPPHGGGAHGSRNGCEAAPADGDPDRDAGAGGDGGVNEEEDERKVAVGDLSFVPSAGGAGGGAAGREVPSPPGRGRAARTQGGGDDADDAEA